VAKRLSYIEDARCLMVKYAFHHEGPQNAWRSDERRKEGWDRIITSHILHSQSKMRFSTIKCTK